MTTHSKSRIVLAFVLAIMIATTGCSAQWINLALQDLPVLTQMALNVAMRVTRWLPESRRVRPTSL